MLETNLVPLRFRKIIWMVRNIAIASVVLTIIFLLIMGICGVFRDTTTAWLFSTGILSVVIPLLIPGFLYERISQSTTVFTIDRIKILDRYGRCWREILYDSISSIRTEEISGFFYGKDRHLCSEKYICFYLNDATEIPNVSYAKLFKNQNFFMIGYHTELQNLIEQKFSKNHYS